jgi:hypothetical protein
MPCVEMVGEKYCAKTSGFRKGSSSRLDRRAYLTERGQKIKRRIYNHTTELPGPEAVEESGKSLEKASGAGLPSVVFDLIPKRCSKDWHAIVSSHNYK